VDALQNARELVGLAAGREGPESNEICAQMAIAYALIAIAEELAKANERAEAELERAEINL